jgi:hypothetical protein
MFILPEVHLPVPEILVIVSSGCPLKRGGCIKAGLYAQQFSALKGHNKI